jgi:hypothetical protein
MPRPGFLVALGRGGLPNAVPPEAAGHSGIDLKSGRYRTVVVNFLDYGSGLVEFGYSYSGGKREKKVETETEIRVAETPEEIASRNARRARTVIRRRIMSLGLDHLLTLTYRGDMEDFTVSLSHLRRFIRLVRKRYPGYRWVAVPEIQRGRLERTGKAVYHWHLAVKGFQDVKFLRQVWRLVAGEGNIDVRGPRGRSRCGKLNLAYYLVKYISKEIKCVSAGLHRYFGTREKGDVESVKISVDRPSSVVSWVKEIMFSGRMVVKQHQGHAFGGWGATWEERKRMEFGVISYSMA